jgi:hypothetical protein
LSKARRRRKTGEAPTYHHLLVWVLFLLALGLRGAGGAVDDRVAAAGE